MQVCLSYLWQRTVKNTNWVKDHCCFVFWIWIFRLFPRWYLSHVLLGNGFFSAASKCVRSAVVDCVRLRKETPELPKWCLAYWSRSQSPFCNAIKTNHNYTLQLFVSSPVIYTNSFATKTTEVTVFSWLKKEDGEFWTCQCCMARLQMWRENAFVGITFDWICSDFICMLWLILCTVKIVIYCVKERESTDRPPSMNWVSKLTLLDTWCQVLFFSASLCRLCVAQPFPCASLCLSLLQ